MGHLIPAGTGLPAYRNLRIDTLGAKVEQRSPEETAKLVEGVSVPSAELASADAADVPAAAKAEVVEGQEAG